MPDDWHTLTTPDEIPSPALLLYPERIEENIRRMIATAGSVDRLRPHVKTHKLAEVVQIQLKAGISKFKCATIAEAEMLAQAGARDVLLANQLVGPNAARLAKLAGWFREVRFSTIADDAEAVGNLASAAQTDGITLPVLLDLDGGMGSRRRLTVDAGRKAWSGVDGESTAPQASLSPSSARRPSSPV